MNSSGTQSGVSAKLPGKLSTIVGFSGNGRVPLSVTYTLAVVPAKKKLSLMSPTLRWHAQRRLASSLKSQAPTIEVRDYDRPEEKEEKEKEKGEEHERKGK
jgi:hypothetical protein